ncbi:MAG: hypothetical protein D6706_00520 [Chloroflexi bacterium]|nr:MAG: hypothetical protein D6706_00520 [Chloroflexota bacterium]
MTAPSLKKKWSLNRLWYLWLDKWQRPFFRVAIILGVLGISAALAYALPQKYMVFILGIPFAIVGGLVLLQKPPLGFLILIVGNLFGRISVPPVGLAAYLLMALTALWLIDMVVRRKEIRLVSSPTIIPLILYIAVAIISFGVGQFPWFPLSPAPLDSQIGGLAIFVLSFCAFLLSAHQIRDIRWLQGMTYIFVILGALIVLGGILPQLRQLNRLLVHPKAPGGSLFWVWLVALSFSQAAFNRKLALPWRVGLAAVTGVTLYVGIGPGRGWVSGWAPPLVAVIVILWLGAPRIAFPLTFSGIALIGIAYQQVVELVLVGDNEYSTVTRLEAWKIVLEIIKVNPILGLGPANYYFYTPLYSILGWYVQFNSHNNYVDIVAQTGLIGLICFLWFVVVTARLGWKLQRQVPSGGFMQAYVYGCLGGLAGMVVAGMLGDWVLPFVYNVGIEGLRASSLGWMFLGGLVAVEQIVALKSQRA